MKIERHGQAKVLSQSEIARLFSEGLTNSRDRALFGICLFTAVRINEACTLRVTDVYGRKGVIHPEIVVRKGNTKGRLATRTIPVIEDLRSLLKAYQPPTDNIHLFPARRGTGHINPRSASNIFLAALRDVGIVGASTHSLRRTALTLMSNSGIPLRVIQEISGHKDLGELQKYLEVTDSQKRGAVSALSLLSPSNMNVGGYVHLGDVPEADSTQHEHSSF
ncbi:MAG: tyrosine-type recombinase/integrase [Actinomycetota bacterium]